MIALPHVDGGFGTIIADPPWRYGDRGSRIAPTYCTMTVDEIAAMPVADTASARALLFMWTTSSFVFEAWRISRAWGFEPRTTMVWVKRGDSGKLQIGMGHYVRAAHELVVIGSRGGQTGIVRNIPSVFFAPRQQHSRKPDALHGIAERLAPGPRLELFARRAVDGWVTWGNEAPETEVRCG